MSSEGDLIVSENGDVSLTESIRQAVLIKLRWIFAEWRLGDTLGFPWYEDVFIKNPNMQKIKNDIRDTVMSVDGVTGSKVISSEFLVAERKARFKFTVETDEDTFTEEVELYA